MRIISNLDGLFLIGSSEIEVLIVEGEITGLTGFAEPFAVGEISLDAAIVKNRQLILWTIPTPWAT